MTYKRSEWLHLTGRLCPKHKSPTVMIDGKERCGGCDIHKAKKLARELRKENCDDTRLEDYNEDIKSRKKTKR